MFLRMIVLYYPRLSIGLSTIDSSNNIQCTLLWFWKLTGVWRSNLAYITSHQYISNEAMPNLVKMVGVLILVTYDVLLFQIFLRQLDTIYWNLAFNIIHILVCSGTLKLIIHCNSKQSETEIEAIHHSFNSYDILFKILLPNAIYNSLFHWNFWKLKLATASIGMKISEQPNRPHGHLHTLDTHTDVSSLSLYIHIYWGVNNAFYTIKMRGES